MTDLEEEILNDLGREISNEIDNSIIAGLYIGLGWKEIILDISNIKEVKQWCEDNFKQGWIQVSDRWIIENEKEAAWFMLKWVS